MQKTNLYPFLFESVYKDYIWGGHRIPEMFGRKISQNTCAESWEVADRPEGMSIIRNGPLTGKSLHEVVEKFGFNLLGTKCDDVVFPLLIKIIDAKQRLSVQVHPDNATAALHGGEAKTECWLTLAGNEGASVFAGLKPGTTAESFRKALDAEELEKLLCEVPAVEGEAIYIPGGRVHAIAEGCLLLEVQQNSNTTYRVYDWGRTGHDGKPRELHVEQAFQSINWNDTAPTPSRPVPMQSKSSNSWFELIKSPYFHLTRLDLSDVENLPGTGETFRVIFVTKGVVEITGNGITENIGPGTTCFLPAALDDCRITPTDDSSSLIAITL